ncbi:MAG: hypothetical protein PQJ46_13405, partial [Spirochaetales bacterium]|nr:hypothetical protein [Spirochaetales bacterium]
MKILESLEVKERIFIYYLLFFFVTALLAILSNIINRLFMVYNYKWIIVCVLCVLFFYLEIFSKKKQIIQRICIYLTVFVLIPGCWLNSPGIDGPAIA